MLVSGSQDIGMPEDNSNQGNLIATLQTVKVKVRLEGPTGTLTVTVSSRNRNQWNHLPFAQCNRDCKVSVSSR